MTKCLIAVHRSWDGQSLTDSQRDRLAASLGIAQGRPAQSSFDGELFLASTGKKSGWRPHVGPDGSFLLFAGHIDNRDAMAGELGIPRDNDEALYAAGYARWGDAVDLRIIGQFATILVPPHRKEVRLVRSPIQAPPLSYWHDRKRLLVASLATAIFATGEVEQRVDEQKIADTLFLNHLEGHRSWFEGVSRLACGSRAKADRDGVTITSYYDLSALPQVHFKDEREYVAAASDLLDEGVRVALDGFKRPAISLSGGYDSQAVAAFVARIRPGLPLEAFTGVPEAGWDGITYDSVFGDERPFVEALAAMYPEIRTNWIDAAGLFLDHKTTSMFMLSGEPPGNAANLHWIHQAYGQARASGCDVMLNGGSGNVSFSFDGDGALATMAKRGQWLRLWKEAGFISPMHSNSRLRAIASRALMPFAPNWLHAMLVQFGII